MSAAIICTYCPCAEDCIEIGKCVVPAEVAEDDNAIHTVPTFGREHHVSRHCWCQPKVANLEDVRRGKANGLLWVHEAEQ